MSSSANVRGTRGVPRHEREAAILRAATHLFGSLGHAHVSVGAIATAAGVSKALVLSYFGSKDALYLGCVEAVTAQVLPAVEQAVSTSPPGFPMALATMHATFSAVREHPHDWRLLADASLPTDSPLRAEVVERTAALHDLGTAGVLTSLGADESTDPLDAGALHHLWSGIVASAMHWWFAHPDETPDTLTARFSRIVAALLPPA